MGANKNQRNRCLILDRCFSDCSKKYQIGDLVREVNSQLKDQLPEGAFISKRTVMADIMFMETPEGGGIRLRKVKEGPLLYYRYVDPNFSITKSPISEQDGKRIAHLTSRYADYGQYPQLHETLSLLELFDADPEMLPFIEFEPSPYLEGLKFLQPMLNAIKNHTALHIAYRLQGKELRHYTLSPQYLKQYNRRWYVMGATAESPDSAACFPLDGIETAETVGDPYTVATVNWIEYFRHTIGMSVRADAVKEDVHFMMFGKVCHFIEANPIHHSQRVHWVNDNCIDVHLKVQVNYELLRLLLSYSNCIKVLSPESLVDSYRSKLQQALSRCL